MDAGYFIRNGIIYGGGIVATSNPNLLDNPWFTINQRGQSSYRVSGYTVDRWRSWDATKDMIVTQNGVSLFGLWQYFENSFTSFLLGRTITMSVKMQNGNIHSETVTLPATEPSQDANFLWSTNSDDNIVFAIDYENSRGIIVVSIRGLDYTNPTLVRAVKLEIGSISTLHLDTASNYASELLKCQRYFIRYNAVCDCAVGYERSATQAQLNFYLPVPLRTNPVLSYGGVVKISAHGHEFNNGIDITALTFNVYNQNVIKAFVDVASGLTINQPCFLHLRPTGYVDISADL